MEQVSIWEWLDIITVPFLWLALSFLLLEPLQLFLLPRAVVMRIWRNSTNNDASGVGTGIANASPTGTAMDLAGFYGIMLVT